MMEHYGTGKVALFNMESRNYAGEAERIKETARARGGHEMSRAPHLGLWGGLPPLDYKRGFAGAMYLIKSGAPA